MTHFLPEMLFCSHPFFPRLFRPRSLERLLSHLERGTTRLGFSLASIAQSSLMGLEWQEARFPLDHNVAKFADLVRPFLLFPGNPGVEDL